MGDMERVVEETCTPQQCVDKSTSFLAEWSAANLKGGLTVKEARQGQAHLGWKNPPPESLKCNIDAALFQE